METLYDETHQEVANELKELCDSAEKLSRKVGQPMTADHRDKFSQHALLAMIATELRMIRRGAR